MFDRRSVVVVAQVDSSSSVARLLRVGDVILEINGLRLRDHRLAARIIYDMVGVLELTVRTVGLLHPTCSASVPYKLKTPPVAQLTKVSFSYSARTCLLYTSPSPRDATLSRMPSSA